MKYLNFYKSEKLLVIDKNCSQSKNHFTSSLKNKKILESQKGFFALSKNDMDTNFSVQDILTTHKSQQSVERGFRFLKSPDFLVSALFLKKPEGMEALLMVMNHGFRLHESSSVR